MRKLLSLLIILMPAIVFSQSKQKTKTAVLIRGGFTVPDHNDPQMMVTASVQSMLKYGLSAGIGIGIARNDVLEMSGIPVFLDLTHVGDVNKIGPMVSLHAGYLIGNRMQRIYNQTITSKGGLLLHGLVGIKFPFKNGKFSFLQGGYGQQTISVNDKNANYGEWVAVFGFKL